MSQLSYQLLIKLNGYNYICGGKRVVNDRKRFCFQAFGGGGEETFDNQEKKNKSNHVK